MRTRSWKEAQHRKRWQRQHHDDLTLLRAVKRHWLGIHMWNCSSRILTLSVGGQASRSWTNMSHGYRCHWALLRHLIARQARLQLLLCYCIQCDYFINGGKESPDASVVPWCQAVFPPLDSHCAFLRRRLWIWRLRDSFSAFEAASQGFSLLFVERFRGKGRGR